MNTDIDQQSRNSAECAPNASTVIASHENNELHTIGGNDELTCLITTEKSVYTFDKGRMAQIITAIGLAISGLFATFCIVVGIIIYDGRLPVLPAYSERNIHINLSPAVRKLYFFALNLALVKPSAYFINTAHHTALKWALAGENTRLGHTRLEFNSNFRFLQSSKKWGSANGLPANVIMALCLAVTYVSSSMIFLGVENNDMGYNTIISYLPPLILGIATLLQVLICIWAIWTTNIPTWSQSPFDTAAVQLQKGRMSRNPGRCMHSLYDVGVSTTPQHPREHQMPIWKSHEQYRRINLYVWLLIGILYYWCFIMWAMTASGTQGSYYGTSWSLLPNPENGRMKLGWMGEAPTFGLLWAMGILVGFQGGIVTTAFTCVDLLVALTVDETIWMKAGTTEGANPSPTFLRRIMLVNWQTLAMYVADPTFHWLFGNALTLDAVVGLQVFYIQILYICLLGTAGIVLITYIGLRRRKRIIPTTYGHLQTLVDLIDEWPSNESSTLYWGHKGYREIQREDGVLERVGHAGTSENLNSVKSPLLHIRYGGSDDC